MSKNTLVLVVRDTWMSQHNVGSDTGSIKVHFGHIQEDGTYTYLKEYESDDDSELKDLTVSCQWNTKPSFPDSKVECFVPYGFHVKSEMELDNFENRVKALKKINKHLQNVPVTQSFGHYVYEICRAVKAKNFVLNPGDSKVEVHAIKDIVDHLNSYVTKNKPVPAMV